MPSRLLAVAFDAPDPDRLASFWAALLRRPVVDEPRGPLLPGDDRQPGLRLVRSGSTKMGPNRLHLHLTSESAGDQQETVARALGLGATPLDVGQRPEEGHIVLADPGGNELCVIEAGNLFLAGCGFLGEVACDGTRAVGVFWGAALGWPMVWDEDEETAIQSPHGGTKIAWGGPPVAPKTAPNRQRFELITSVGQQEGEADRLVDLGAVVLQELADGAQLLADPDGNELVLSV
jgi:hypothetical protein